MPIAMASSYPYVLVVHPSLPVRSARELVALVKWKPDALAYASAGAGTMSHLAMEMMRIRTDTRMTHLPYKGAAPASVALMSGEAQAAFIVLPVVHAQAKAGKMRALAVAAPTRSAVIAQVPTMREAGIERHEAVQWNGFFAPPPDAATGHRPAESRPRESTRRSGSAQAVRGAGRDAGRQHAGGVRLFRSGRVREVGGGRAEIGNETGLTPTLLPATQGTKSHVASCYAGH
jgi:hypothetical protein